MITNLRNPNIEYNFFSPLICIYIWCNHELEKRKKTKTEQRKRIDISLYSSRFHTLHHKILFIQLFKSFVLVLSFPFWLWFQFHIHAFFCACLACVLSLLHLCVYNGISNNYESDLSSLVLHPLIFLLHQDNQRYFDRTNNNLNIWYLYYLMEYYHPSIIIPTKANNALGV